MKKPVLKPGDPWISTGTGHFDLRDIARQSEATMAAARLEAFRILEEGRAQARAEKEAVFQAAHRAGREEGLKEGRASGHAQALAEARQRFANEQTTLISTLTDLVRKFEASRDELYLSARQDVIVLAITIASRIVNRLISIGPIASEVAENACWDALTMLSEATEAVIRIHPADIEILGQLCDSLVLTKKEGRNIRLQEDASLERGGVIVESANGVIDARIGPRLERIADELMTGWKERFAVLHSKSDSA